MNVRENWRTYTSFGVRLFVSLFVFLTSICLAMPIWAAEDQTQTKAGEAGKAGEAEKTGQEEADDYSLNMHFLDVGQGLAVLMESDGHYVMYDGGGRNSSDQVVAYLKKQGVESLDAVIASHYDEDHIAGLIGVLEVFDVAEVYAPDYEGDTNIYEAFQIHLEDSEAEVRYPVVGDSIAFGTAKIRFLGPERYDHAIENDNSICAMVTCGAVKFLLPGDAESGEEEELIQSGRYLRADVLVAGHHGSGKSTSEALLKKVRPSSIVLSCGKDVYGLPAREVIEKLQSLDVELYRTDEQGTLIASTDGEELKWSTEPSKTWAYREDQTEAAVSEEASAGSRSIQNEDEPAEAEEEKAEDADVRTYILNVSSGKFHLPSCDSVNKMKETNKQERTDTRENIMAAGYDPCQNCNP